MLNRQFVKDSVGRPRNPGLHGCASIFWVLHWSLLSERCWGLMGGAGCPRWGLSPTPVFSFLFPSSHAFIFVLFVCGVAVGEGRRSRICCFAFPHFSQSCFLINCALSLTCACVHASATYMASVVQASHTAPRLAVSPLALASLLTRASLHEVQTKPQACQPLRWWWSKEIPFTLQKRDSLLGGEEFSLHKEGQVLALLLRRSFSQGIRKRNSDGVPSLTLCPL